MTAKPTKPQISPLRCAPVEMTNLLRQVADFHLSEYCRLHNQFVISTGAQRSGEICGLVGHHLTS
jgi:hypothetical protein